MEILWTGLSSLRAGGRDLIGHTSVWMFFLYGSAVFFFEPVHQRIAHLPILIRGGIWTLLIFSLEFVGGLLFQKLGISAWHYTGRTAILGLIRLDYAPLWFLVGLLFEKIHNLLLHYHIGIK